MLPNKLMKTPGPDDSPSKEVFPNLHPPSIRFPRPSQSSSGGAMKGMGCVCDTVPCPCPCLPLDLLSFAPLFHLQAGMQPTVFG